MKPTLVVLAAGLGSRYGSLKQIDPVGPGGELLLDYAVYDALQAGFGTLVFVIRRSFEDEFRDLIAHKYHAEAEVRYVYQELDNLPAGLPVSDRREKPWGTGHALLVAGEKTDTPFAVINADDYYGRGAFELQNAFLTSSEADASHFSMVGYVLRNTLSEHGAVSRGVCSLNGDGTLTGVVEHTDIGRKNGAIVGSGPEGGRRVLTGDEIVSMNLWGFTPSVFDAAKRQFMAFYETRGDDPKAEFYIPSVVDGMIGAGEASVQVFRSDEEWFGVTYRRDKPVAVQRIRQLIERGVYPERLWG